MGSEDIRTPDSTDGTDEALEFVAPSLMLLNADVPQSRHDRRGVVNALRWIMHTGAPWCVSPTNVPPWAAVDQRTQRWLAAGCFEPMAHDLRALRRWAAGRADGASAMIRDARTMHSTPKNGGRAGDERHERREGSTTRGG